jgi:hypothetical protein
MTGQVPAGPVENSLSSLASEYPEGHQYRESTLQRPKHDRVLNSLSPCGQLLVGHESARITGRSLMRDMLSTTFCVNAPRLTDAGPKTVHAATRRDGRTTGKNLGTMYRAPTQREGKTTAWRRRSPMAQLRLRGLGVAGQLDLGQPVVIDALHEMLEFAKGHELAEVAVGVELIAFHDIYFRVGSGQDRTGIDFKLESVLM